MPMSPTPTAHELGLISKDSATKLARLPGQFLARAEFFFTKQLDDWRRTATEVLGQEEAHSVLFELSLNPDVAAPDELEFHQRQWGAIGDGSLRFYEPPSVDSAATGAHRELIDRVFLMKPLYEKRYDLRAALIIEGLLITSFAAELASDAGVVPTADVSERSEQLANNVRRYRGMVDLRETSVSYFPELDRLDDIQLPPSLADAVTMAQNDLAGESSPHALAHIASAFATTQLWRRDIIPLIGAFERSSGQVADEFRSEAAWLIAENCRELRGVIVDFVDNVDRVGRTHALTHVLRAAHRTIDLGLGNGPGVKVPSQVSFALQSEMIELSGMTTTALAAKIPDLAKQVARDVIEATRMPQPQLVIDPRLL